MGLFDSAKRFFGTSAATPADDRKLSATTESALGRGLQNLSRGARGWITLAEAARLFSTQEPQMAFGDLDEAGKTALAEFAAQYRCMPQFMPMEGRLYFQRNT